jgi:glutathione S-transferase
MKLYMFPHSPYSRKVLLAIYEKGLTVDSETVIPHDRSAKERLLGIYPIFTLPLLVLDDGSPLPESSIIVEHLDLMSAAGPLLLPADPKEALHVRAWDRLGDHLLAATAYLAFALGKPAEKQNAERIAANRRMVRAVLDLVERKLLVSTYLHGDGLTLADLGPLCAVASLLSDGSLGGLEPWPGVASWFARVTSRLSWQRIGDDCRAVPLPTGLHRR